MSGPDEQHTAGNAADPRKGALGGAVRTFSGFTLLSRIAGLVRDLVTVRIFGDTALGSAFAAAFAIPNLFRRLFGEGALAAAFLPGYARLERDDAARGDGSGQADRFVSVTLVWLAFITGLITVALELLLLTLLLVLEPDPDRDLSFRLIMVMLPFMPLVCIAAILGAALQVHGRFAPSAGAPLLLNACLIAAASLHFVPGGPGPVASAYIIGVAAVVAGVSQVGWCLLALRGRVRWTRDTAPVRDEARAMLRRFVPVALGLGTIQLNALLDTLIAMWPNWVGPTILGFDYPLDTASNSVLSYTQRLYQFPLGVFGIAVATAAFPLLSRDANDPARFGDTLRRALRLAMFIALPAGVGLVLVREDLTAVVFGGGGTGFSDAGLRASSAVLLGYAAGLWAYSANHVLVRAFYAQNDTLTPVRIALAAVGLNLVLNVVLIWPLREAGLAWSTAISAGVQTLVLAYIASRRFDGPLLARGVGRGVGVSLLMAALMGVGVAALLWLMPERTTWTGHAAALGAACVLGVAIYGGIAAIRRPAELRWLLERRAEGPG